MCWAVKLHDVLFDRSALALIKWLSLDALWICLLPQLRIPRLMLNWNSRIALVAALAFLNITIFGRLPVPFTLQLALPTFPGFPKIFRAGGPDISTDERHVWANDVVDGHGHLLGQHTVKLSPILTAHLNPPHMSFCLSPPHNEVLVPILLNNSRPNFIEYSISPLGDKSPKMHHRLYSKDLVRIEKQWREYYEDARSSLAYHSASSDGFSKNNVFGGRSSTEDEPYDEEYENDNYNKQSASAEDEKQASEHRAPRRLSSQERQFYSIPLQPTQSIIHISVTRPGVVRLESMSVGNSNFRITPAEVVVVTCPSARFEVPQGSQALKRQECVGTTRELSIVAEGVAPLKLKWHKDVNGRREDFIAEGIEGNPEATNIPLSQNITIPISVPLSTLGKHRYAIDSLIDGVGNTFDVGSAVSNQNSRSVDVVRRSSVSFRNCRSTQSIDLLKGSEARLVLALGSDGDPVKSVTLQYVPPIGYSAPPYEKAYSPRSETDRELSVTVKQPGTYTILAVNGKECRGDVLSPEVCKVVEQPKPKVDVTLKSIHECSGDVGVRASLVFHGTPPFTIYYTEQRNRDTPKRLQKTISGARDEIILQPDSSGTYTYSFSHVSDRNYRQVPLEGDGLSIKQTVHPLASADFVRPSGAGSKRTVNSCSGDRIDVDVDLRGSPPWTVDLQVVDSAKTEVITFPGLMKSRSRITLPIPEGINTEGGEFQVDLVSVVDATGCSRSLNVPGLSYNVQRIRPTARFYSSENTREVTVLEGEVARLPLRLTGERPWTVRYRRAEAPEQTLSARFDSANEALEVRQSGTYELVAGTEDFAEIRLSGQPPYQIMYSHSLEYGADEQATFNSVQPTARLQMKTANAGRHSYRIVGVGDASYPALRNAHKRYLEQTVLSRPSASFRSTERLSYCVGDSFKPLADHGNHGLVDLKGQPPFTLELSVKNMATGEYAEESVTVNAHEWTVELPSHTFKSIGSSLVTIESIKDSSPCPEVNSQPARRSIYVDVAETAAIVPFERKVDYCVGEPISFQLEGTPPWTVNYVFKQKVIKATSSNSKFSRVPIEPGIFKIMSIAHQRNMCQSNVDDLEMHVHAVPSARVSRGRKKQDVIREGDQAHITFELLGTPPFTFTYQRTELPDPSKGKPPQVLETHTVSGVTSRTYSISSSQEGTWTVTFIADKYCRYPPNPPDTNIESA
ncbi:hypothetical protein FRB99_008481 [Tulasnella sp. 403]|nr:hypothetical protein FRB99_008481 [Tulasnella sp. 403]